MNDLLKETSAWLWDYYLISSLLLALVWVASKLILQPARRMALHWAMAVGLLLLALLCGIPSWSVVHITTAPPEPEWTEYAEPTLDPAVQIAKLPTEFQPDLSTELEASLPLDTSPVTSVPQPASEIIRADLGIYGLLIVGAGALLSVAWLTIGAWQVRRLRSQAMPASVELQKQLKLLANSGESLPEVGLAEKISVAVATGLMRPMILLPNNFSDSQSSESIRAVLAHELAHIRHRDLWLLAMIRGISIVLWCHPLFWLWRRQVRLDQETLADAAATEVASRADYAEQLVSWARFAVESKTPRLASSVGLWESPSQLRQRISVLLDEKFTILQSASRKWRVGSLVLLAALAMSLSLFTLQPEKVAVAEETSPEVSENAQSSQESTAENSSKNPSEDFDGSENATSNSINQDAVGRIQKLHRQLYDECKPNTITGICLNQQGQPLSDVEITVYTRPLIQDKRSRLQHKTKSDADGKFMIEDVVEIAETFPDGIPDEHLQWRNPLIYSMTGRLKGYTPGIGSHLASEIARSGQTNAWVMQPAQTLRGRIIDQEGKPIEDAKVSAGFALMNQFPGINSAITNAKGEYVIEDLPAYSYAEEKRQWEESQKNADPETQWLSLQAAYSPSQMLFVKHPQYAAKRTIIENIPGEVDVKLNPGSILGGRVALPEGTEEEITGIVRLERAMPPSEPQDGYTLSVQGLGWQTESDTIAQGGFGFDSLPSGRYHLTAEVEGWTTQGIENVAVLEGETVRAPDMKLTKGGIVKVQLVDHETGKPLNFEEPTPGYLNASHRPPRPGIFSFRNNTVEYSRDGKAEIQIAPGYYTLNAFIPSKNQKNNLMGITYDGVTSPEDMNKVPAHEIKEGETLQLEIKMRKEEAPARGTLTLAGTPVSESDKGQESKKDANAKTNFVPAEPIAEDEKQSSDNDAAVPPPAVETKNQFIPATPVAE